MGSASEVWDEYAPSFDLQADHGLRDREVRDAWWAVLSSVLPDAPARIADLGCGTGSVTTLLAEHGVLVEGIDISPDMLRIARAKEAQIAPAASCVEGDAGDPPLQPGAFDAVFCRHVLWVFDDQDAVLPRWIRLLRPGARLIHATVLS